MSKKPKITKSSIDDFFPTTTEKKNVLPVKQAENSRAKKEVNKLTNKQVNKNLTSRNVKGFQLTKRSQNIVKFLAVSQNKNEYEIVEEGLELILKNQTPEIRKIIEGLEN